MRMSRLRQKLSAMVLLPACLFAAGCSQSPSAGTNPEPSPSSVVQGKTQSSQPTGMDPETRDEIMDEVDVQLNNMGAAKGTLEHMSEGPEWMMGSDTRVYKDKNVQSPGMYRMNLVCNGTGRMSADFKIGDYEMDTMDVECMAGETRTRSRILTIPSLEPGVSTEGMEVAVHGSKGTNACYGVNVTVALMN